MAKLTLPGQPAPQPAPRVVTPPAPKAPAVDLKALTIDQLYDHLDTIDERANRDYYWVVNHEIARRKVTEDRALVTELRELRAAVHLMKLAMEDLIFKFTAAEVTVDQPQS